MTAPRVLHLVDEFGARSQTFIYTYVTSHRTFSASVLCRDWQLRDEFPFADVTVVPETWSRRNPSRWWAMLSRAATGTTPWQRQVRRYVAATRPDILHAHFGQLGVRVLPAIHALGIPLITSFYGYDATGFANSARGQRSVPALLAGSATILAEGPVMRERLVRLGAPEDRVRVVPIAIDPAKYPTWSPAPEPFVLFLARFVEKKGLLDAVAAFARARAALPSLRLRVIGSGPDEARARAAAADLRVGDVIDWLGLKPHRECIEHMRRAAVMIQPSITARDGDTEGGAPTTLIEAQAIGTPVVATRHADIPHIAPPGDGVWLADEHDVSGLANGIVTLIERRTSSRSSDVASRHGIRSVVPVLEQCYHDALARHVRRVA